MMDMLAARAEGALAAAAAAAIALHLAPGGGGGGGRGGSCDIPPGNMRQKTSGCTTLHDAPPHKLACNRRILMRTSSGPAACLPGRILPSCA